MARPPTGLRERHSRRCASKDGGRCNCEPAFEAWVFSRRDGQKIRKTFTGTGARSAAKAWRADATVSLSKGTLRAPSPQTLEEAWKAWHEGALAGTIRTRSGDPFKPSALRSYEIAMRLRVLPDFGAVRLADIRRPDLQGGMTAKARSRPRAKLVGATCRSSQRSAPC